MVHWLWQEDHLCPGRLWPKWDLWQVSNGVHDCMCACTVQCIFNFFILAQWCQWPSGLQWVVLQVPGQGIQGQDTWRDASDAVSVWTFYQRTWAKIPYVDYLLWKPLKGTVGQGEIWTFDCVSTILLENKDKVEISGSALTSPPSFKFKIKSIPFFNATAMIMTWIPECKESNKIHCSFLFEINIFEMYKI